MADPSPASSPAYSSSICGNCGKKGAKKRCSRCTVTFYCDEDCQRKSWRLHKKECFEPNSTCFRCLEPAKPGTLCRVKHPPHLVQGMGGSYGAGKSEDHEQCAACNQSYTKVRRLRGDTNVSFQPPSGEFCYVGPHTVKPLRSDDERRVQKDVMCITFSEDMQEKIDAIPSEMPDVRILTFIKGASHWDDSNPAKLTVDMPNLEQLRCIDVVFGEIKLHCPVLKDVEFQNVGDECEFEIVAPKLKNLKFYYYHGDDETWLNKTLEHAKELVSFDSYKLRVGHLAFASNHLEYVRLHRAELLTSLSIWAPRLKHLSLQACYSLYHLKILDDHPLKSDLPLGMRPSVFEVDSTNACLSDEVVEALNSNDRVRWDGPDVDSDVGAPMDAFFSQMYGSGGRM